jgi:hypothetical protein
VLATDTGKDDADDSQGDVTAEYLPRPPQRQLKTSKQQSPSASVSPAKKHQPLDDRARYAIGLRATSRLASARVIGLDGRALLKELILSDDDRIESAVRAYETTADLDKVRVYV